MHTSISTAPGRNVSRCLEPGAVAAGRFTVAEEGCEGESGLVADYGVPVFRVELVTERTLDAPVVTTPEEIAVLLQEFLARFDREAFVVVMLATNNRVIGINVAHVGSLSASIVNVREVFKPAVLANAASIIVAHNHPSGNLEPSVEDVRISRKLKDAGALFEIPVLDSIIVGQGGYTSLAERGAFA